MKWEDQRSSDNVEDRRDSPGQAPGGGFSLGGGRLGLGTVLVILAVGWFMGISPLTLLQMLGEGGGSVSPAPTEVAAPAHGSGADDRLARFVSVVLADTEDVWKDIFASSGGQYRDPRLVLFRGSTPTSCGQGQAAMGPFYCPADQKVYIDLGFYEVLKTRLGAPGDFAQAYVIAHEVGHHVQHLLGISQKLDDARGRVSQAQYNALSVRLELQADCLAGVWAHHADRSRHILEQGDVASAMNAAAHIGDDALQKSAGRAVVPESFTHGTSAQRQRWFATGLQLGTVRACDTFNARNL
ncbi:neutral zinc metallopeptidase [Curvibacter sp. RS43]|uniref:Neutral zinc metallopeptidase n=1 Tax=Curvibacter microcysteis TaxID=3026419 RepID=A0ABT5MIF5_9BURK|nr:MULTISPECIES: neutral zinc metallopeptidase [unclassified Curvibacter]MDD0810590.1 neutral zinc metallopeptidase [Curvibacter sp. RS43]MDD0815672.1 neutral zinc metallopeptidase [Curvibacter sp. HBC28]